LDDGRVALVLLGGRHSVPPDRLLPLGYLKRAALTPVGTAMMLCRRLHDVVSTLERDIPARSSPCSIHSLRRSPRSCRMPRQPLGAPESLPKGVPRQVAFGEHEVPSVPNDRPPILKSRSWRLVSDQLPMAGGKDLRARAHSRSRRNVTPIGARRIRTR
jgi:hypothetical protein